MEDGIKVIIAFVAAHAAANIVKVIIRNLQVRKNLGIRQDIRIILDSGGMPSAHTACLAGATTMVGWLAGWTSLEFAMVLAVLFVVMYDAINVRYAVGEQGKRLNALLRRQNEQEIKIVEGHTVAQVAVGLLIGIAVGSLMYLILR